MIMKELYPPVMATMTLDARPWSRSMRIHSTQKPAWSARRSPAEPTHLPLHCLETYARAMSFFPL